jgi:OOP family OmpA-OmpF porin
MAVSRADAVLKSVACLFSALLLSLALFVPALADDIEGSKDHPLVGRYKDSKIVFYKAGDFDEAVVLQAPHDYGTLLEKNATKDRSGPEWLKLEGKVAQIRYELPEGRSALEVIRNFETALKTKGFTVLFACADSECLTGSMKDLYLLGEQLDPENNISTAYSGHARYLLAKLDRPEGAVYASILVGEEQGNGVAFVKVVEVKPMEGDKIEFLKSAEMQSSIEKSGSVNLYGIQFDFDKDTLRPDSKPTLDEIAKLLNGKAALKLKIVGHTDDKGKADYNQSLSERRAASVVASLVKDYGIDGARLSSEGAGMTKPLVPNDTDENRAKNRRVELVAQ